MGCALFIAGLVLSAVLGFKAGSVLNGGTITTILILELVVYFFYTQWSRGRELEGKDIFHLGIFLCFCLFSVIMLFVAIGSMNLNGDFVTWLKNLTFR